MKVLFKILMWIGIIIVVLVLGFAVFVLNSDKRYEAPYPEISAVSDSAVVARGAYLVNGPAHCAHCHAAGSDFSKVEMGEMVPLKGGFYFALPIGTVYPPNITSHPESGIGSYTDEELARALRYGVKKDGKPLMDFMPFYDLSDEDLVAVISYLRTLAPVENQMPENEFNFLGKTLVALGAIKPMGDGEVPEMPKKDSTVLYGQYLANSVANCQGCHTNRDLKTGGWIGEKYAGGFAMEMIESDGTISKDKHVISPNITPDEKTSRISGWTQKDFLTRFRKGRLIEGSPMPWGPFSRMSDLELIAIYKYLQTLKPVENETPVGVQEGPMGS